MNQLLTIAGIACFAVLLTEASGIVYRLKYQYVWKIKTPGRWKPSDMPRWKPFDCPMCLAWWSGIVYGIINHMPVFSGIGFAATCSILAIIISKQIRI